MLPPITTPIGPPIKPIVDPTIVNADLTATFLVLI